MIQNILQSGVMSQKNGNRREGTFLLRNLHGCCRIKAVKDAEKIGLPLHLLLHHLPVNLRRFLENYVDSGKNRESEKSAEKPEILGI